MKISGGFFQKVLNFNNCFLGSVRKTVVTFIIL